MELKKYLNGFFFNLEIHIRKFTWNLISNDHGYPEYIVTMDSTSYQSSLYHR